MASRGRARGRAAAGAAAAMGAPAAAPAGGVRPAGRGRARGTPAPAEEPPVQQMAAMGVGNAAAASGGPPAGGVRERGSRFAPGAMLKPDHVQTTRGESGRPLQLSTNYFQLDVKASQPFYQYHVTFNPPVDSLKMRKGLMYNIKRIEKCHIFDGNLLYCPVKMDGEEVMVTSRRGENITIKMQLTQEVAVNSPQFMQVVNILFNSIATRHMGLEQIRRDFFNPKKAIPIPQHKIELYPGYEFTIRNYNGGTLLGLDIKHKVLRTDSVLEFMNSVARGPGGNQNMITKQLVGAIVMTKYNNKTYRVDDIAFDKKASDSVELKRETTTYIDYYMRNYEMEIKDKNQPLLVCRSKTKVDGAEKEVLIHLVPEVCYMTGLTDNMRANFKVMQDLAQYTRQKPDDRLKGLLGFRNTIAESEGASAVLEQWGLNMASNISDVEGRQVAPPVLLTKDGKMNIDERKAAFDNITRKNFVITSANMGNDYSVIVTSRDQANAREFMETASKVGPACGINIGPNGNVVAINSDRAEDYINAIRNNAANSKFVVCLVPNDKKDRYDAIKKHCCIDQPIPSQVLQCKNLNPKKKMSVVTKVVMQMNAKMGGELWSVHIPMKKVMYVGIDTYHDSGSSRSVGGIVASMNDACTRYYSKTTWQPSKQELISQLDVVMSEILKAYKSKNGDFPDRILIFRDGVGDGQLLAVKEQELKNIKDAVQRASVDKKIELVFTVVTKRIQQRFFLKMGRGLNNPPPGTVVDSMVTRDELFDFFLVPQGVSQGTVTPTHYNVLEFSTTLKPDHLQQIAYKMCFMYYNWTGAIRVPAPCQYAHKLAFLVGQSLHRDPSPDLADLLYYL